MRVQGIHPRRLIYLTEEIYSKILGISKRYNFNGRKRKKVCLGGEGNLRSRLLSKKILVGRSNGNGNDIGFCYEGTNIESTRDSEYWNWQRLKEYWQDVFDGIDTGALESVSLMRG